MSTVSSPPTNPRRLTQLWDGDFYLRDDFGDIPIEMGVCRWLGNASQWRAHLKAPLPIQLAAFGLDGVNWFDRVHPHDLTRVRQNVADAAAGKPSVPFEYRMLAENGDIVWVRHWWSKEVCGRREGDGGHLSGIVQVIDELKHLEEECLRAGDWVRRQVGQELHDDVCQILAGVACMLERFGREAETASPHLGPTFAELVNQVKGGMTRARLLAHGLVPSCLIELGLPASLVELARQTAAQWGVTVRTNLNRELKVRRPEQILHLYRIAQEAISNAVKHGKATNIELGLQGRDQGLSLTIRDNGIGLPSVDFRTDGLGLHSMRYRAAAIGADISIGQVSTGGTIITVTCQSPGPGDGDERHGA